MRNKVIITIAVFCIGLLISLFCYGMKESDLRQIEEVTKEFDKLAKIPNNKDSKTFLQAEKQIAVLKEEKDENIYEKELKETLNYYYENKQDEKINVINNTIDDRGKEIVNNYKEAAKERNNKDTNYQTDTVILTMPIEEDAEKITNEYDGKVINVMSVSDSEKLVVVDISNEYTTKKAIDNYESISDGIVGQVNYKYSYEPNSNVANMSSTKDAYSSYQWYLNKNTGINAYEAWNLLDSMSHSKVKVGVIDSGVNNSLDDLKTNLKWANDNNKHVTIDSVTGAMTSGISDSVGHGTHVTGLIGATSNNNIGISGAAAGNKNDIVDVIVVDALNDDENGFYTIDMVSAIEYLQSLGVKVINMSLGRYGSADEHFTYDDYVLHQSVYNAYSNGVTIVAAAGNENTSSFVTPSDYIETIGVVSIDGNNTKSNFSNYNKHKDIAAPGGKFDLSSELQGVGLVSTYGANLCQNDECNWYEYVSMQGTSQAAPLVTSVVAMMYSVYPNLTPSEIKNIISMNADDLGTPGKDVYYGYGKINPVKILNSLRTKIINENNSIKTIQTVKNVSASLKTYNSVYLKWSAVSNIDGYMIYYRKANTSDWYSFNSRNNSVIKSNLEPGYKYYFKVKAYRNGNYSRYYSNEVSAITLKKPVIKLKKSGSNKVKVKYSDIPGESGYLIYRKKAGKKWKLIATRSTSVAHSFKDTVKKGKKYYYKVKAYKWVGKSKVYSQYSATKSIRR